MQSTAADVDAYLAEVPAERREVLAASRQLCRENLSGYAEGMDYGPPVELLTHLGAETAEHVEVVQHLRQNPCQDAQRQKDDQRRPPPFRYRPSDDPGGVGEAEEKRARPIPYAVDDRPRPPSRK